VDHRLIQRQMATSTLERNKLQKIKRRNVYRVSENLCHYIFQGIPHPQLNKKFPISMVRKMDRFRDIHCCVEIGEML
jgi:hypothetical protein